MVASHQTAHQRAGREAIASFLHIDRIGAAAGGVIVTVATIILRRPLLLLPVIAIFSLVVALTVAQRALEAGLVHRSLALAVLGNWFTALAVAIAIPQLWPVMVITILVPVVLATPHLDNRQLSLLVGGAVASAISVTLIGLLGDDGGALPDLDDGYEMALIVGALVAHVIPSALIVWNNNRIQSDAMDRLTTLNLELEASGEALATSRQRVVEAADGERRRLERDLHDGAQQHLVALGVRLRLLEDTIGAGHELHGTVTDLIGAADEAVEELRRLAHGIYPPLLESSGLAPALGATARQSGLDVDAQLADIGRLDPAIERALYFTALEALSNAAKHAPGATVNLRLSTVDQSLANDAPAADDGPTMEPLTVQLVVQDDGPGFDADEVFANHGTNNMGDRLAVIGGTLSIESSPGAGTTVTAMAPHRGASAGCSELVGDGPARSPGSRGAPSER